MELGHPTPHPFLRSPADRGRHYPLRRRLLARAFSWRVDQALAAGADPRSDPLITCRAVQLVSGATRDRLADGLCDAVEQAALPRPTTVAAPLASARVRANSGLLLALAGRLDFGDPIEPRGAAKAHQLLMHGDSPLYEPASPLRLEDEVEAILIALRD